MGGGGTGGEAVDSADFDFGRGDGVDDGHEEGEGYSDDPEGRHCGF